MKNNLYYTPTIEEFHVGFEYEYKPKVGPWVKINYNNWMSPSKGMDLDFCTEQDLLRKFDIIDQCIKREDVRCKFLDQSDIESLGWKDCDNIYNTIRWDFNDYILMFYKKDNRYLIFRDCGPNNIQTVFNGFIKNKSELIKLQQQLDIK